MTHTEDTHAAWEARMAAADEAHRARREAQAAEVRRFTEWHVREETPTGGSVWRPKPGWQPICHGSIIQRH